MIEESPPGKSEGVHRLVDMVVEEVSLVDRAANKHRFLVVKRDAPMKDDTESKTDDAETPEAAPPPKPKKKPAKKADTADAIATATGILERLTTAVELLGEASDDDADQILIELAGELSEAASEIAEAAGVAEDEEEGSEAQKRTGVADAVAKVRALLGEVGSLLAAAKTTPAAEPEPTLVAAAAASEASDAVAKQLEVVASSLRTLTDAVKEQGQRLARVEKGTALPNSRTHDERPLARDEDIGWPLDLNRPLDRESVDKATSFHDR
jgi:hypothetical protein